jgi:tryptophan-rich sensory protein
MTKNNFFKLIIAIVVSELAGVISSFFTVPAISSGWYAGLEKSSFNPPAWVFAPAWTILFALMGIAAWLVWRKKEIASSSPAANPRNDGRIKTALWIFGGQLLLNILWSVFFFGTKNPGAAFIEIIILWLAILATIIYFAKISKVAAWLLIPYILWVSFAAYLNFSIWQLSSNKDFPEQKSVAELLAECLPMSDWASKEKCDALLAKITDFDSCVSAGFSIMKSNPPQCATPDGRNFTEKINMENNLQITDITVGTGAEAKNGNTVEVNYLGTFLDGKKFDSSYDRGVPFSFRLGAGDVIKGWDQGVLGMKVGGKRKLIVPPILGYGDKDYGPIPANSTLAFEVELLGVK